MNYDTLKLFLRLSHTLHFGKTSQECYMSPSTLSRVIQRLEDEIGHSLFIRNNRQVILTAKGEQFQQYAIDTLAEWESFQAHLNDDAETLYGEISLFCSVTACYSILPTILRQFRKTYSEIHLKVEVGNSVNALKKIKDGLVDVIIAALPEKVSPDLDFRIIVETPLIFVAPKMPCQVNDQVNHSLIAWEKIPMILHQTGLARTYVNKWCQKQGFTPQIYSEVVGNEAILALVSMGCGVGVVPKMVFDKSPLQSAVSIINTDERLIESPLPKFKVGVCLQKKKLRFPLVQAFWHSILID